jgi:hypothetical protein
MKIKNTEILPKQMLEVVQVEHKGIKVMVEIDHISHKACLVEYDFNVEQFDVKEWVFGRRELPYMNSWLDILDAMKKAVEYGKERLEHQLAEDSKFSEDFIKSMTNLK